VIDSKQFEKVDLLFDEALDRPPEERLRYVEERCEGDADLAEEVRKLLELSSANDALLDSGAMKGPLWDEVAEELQHGRDNGPVAGSRIGPYEVVGLIGRGGMGSVYRAKDPTLGRDVAIKALSGHFSEDGSTLRRFEREAKTLASLNHPNIASIYDLLQVDGKRYLILEYVEGETLAERLARGPLELADLFRTAEQIAEALVEAHGKGIVHRDLKPANIKLTPEGRVKVLDFGLAKPQGASASRATDPSALTTQVGVVLGTPGYMSPEQARGESVDRRTDVWAFGCLLYEMLCGEPAFGGKTPSDAIASVLRDPIDWERIPPGTPLELRRLAERCLTRDPRDRLQDIGDARIEVKEVSRPDRPRYAAEPLPRSMSRWVILASTTAFIAGMAFFRAVGLGPVGTTEGALVRATIALGPETRLRVGASGSLALSPDGARLAFVGERDGRIQLFLRALDDFEPTVVRGSDGARDPFFSADGKWIGFFAEGEMRRVALAGGVTETVAAAGLQSRGASWSLDDRIVFAQDNAPGIQVVPASGGAPVAISDPSAGEDPAEHLWPQWLPGGSVLFTVRSLRDIGVVDELAVLDVETGAVNVLGLGSQASYLSSGRIVYAREGALEVAPFDADTGALVGTGLRLVDAVNAYPVGSATYAASLDGVLTYLDRTETTALDRTEGDGESAPLPLPPGTPGWPRISPDGRRAAVHIGGNDSREVWVLDLERPGSNRQLTFQGGGFPIWSPDGTQIVFMSRRAGNGDLYIVPADGSGSASLLLAGRTRIPVSWSASGALAYYQLEDDTQRDIWVADVNQPSEPVLFVGTPANELSPAFSPDGRFIAYVSNETGQNEIYVRPYPPPGAVTAVSIDGGSEPVWSADGTELFYRRGSEIVSAPVRTASEFSVGSPSSRLSAPALPGAGGNPSYDSFPNSPGFLILRPLVGSEVDRLRLVLNWDDDLERLPSPD